ncbi:dihydroxyacetone kinase phosphoryl donor subunit DhaM [Yinghuangia seranimata]|uniref:dihydroxyacetone kinase phosphoryl donor subunit DhaM n=1 Tax=Yinghuangia seranimata TaxID=408067 RepID=UPI00248C2D87|nr:dihydroxyacetone kinase phosphoryl donor subunit DhaM [Yinghuangia seranimata]MDI2130262.1 dihydroxyacetone kinase phosphoryl donor subunit DhaM [Yinghuangia seranimata]
MPNVGNLVGLVLVSHSVALAEGVRELVAQLGGEVPVAVAAGAPDGGLGTSVERVAAALAEADRGAGVVVLPDLGSAVLTVRALLDDEPRPGARLVDAPFVEGAVAAVAVASTGAVLAEVVAAAEEARRVRKF